MIFLRSPLFHCNFLHNQNQILQTSLPYQLISKLLILRLNLILIYDTSGHFSLSSLLKPFGTLNGLIAHLIRLLIEFENNQNSEKNDGAIIQSGPFNISIRALLATNPLNGKIINETPFTVSIWRRQKFDLEKLQGFEKEGCETPSESAFLKKDLTKSGVNKFCRRALPEKAK